MSVGLFFTALILGVRHGIDWDHIAAIADLTGAAESRRRGLVLSLLYAVGHAIVVFMLGVALIVAGRAIPESVASWMGRVVGVTLILLGCWILFELVTRRRDFRLRSRWMLLVDGSLAGVGRVRQSARGRVVEIDHDHPHDHSSAANHSSAAGHRHDHRKGHRSGHRHRHRHEVELPGRATGRDERSPGAVTATGIGMLHGVGVESPTQIAVFVASTTVVGATNGLVLLSAWVIGLILANTVLAVLAGAGVLQAERNFAIYATVAVVVAVLSIAMGVVYVLGFDVLPGILS